MRTLAALRSIAVVLTSLIVLTTAFSVPLNPSDAGTSPPSVTPFSYRERDDPSAPTYTALPSWDPDDGKFLAVAGQGMSTLAGVEVILYIGLSPSKGTFEVGVFDGDTGANWDLAGTGDQLVYRLYRDPLKNFTKASLVAQWTSDDAVNDAWYTRTFNTDDAARAPSGNYFYRLEANWADPSSTSFNNFKVRTTGQISLRAGQEFGFAGGPQNIPPFAPDGSACPETGTPNDPPVGTGDPHPGEINDPNANSYDGDWSWYFYVPTTLTDIAFRDGDADRANDPNSPGAPPDDGTTYGKCALVTPSIYFQITDPAGHVYQNNNPSGNEEWEDFSIGPDASDNVRINYTLSPGLWRFRVRGMDAHNADFLRASYEIYSTSDPPLTVSPVPQVEPDHTITTPDGVTLTFAHTVKNKGAPDSFDLKATDAHGWTTRLYHDVNGDGDVDVGEPIVTKTPTLLLDETFPIALQVDVPPGTGNVDDTATVTASSRTEWALQDDADNTIRVRVNQSPEAHAGGPYVADEGAIVTFDASASFDPDGDPLTYRWDWDADGAVDYTTTDPIAAHAFGDDLVNHVVILEVSDGDLTDSTVAYVTIVNVSPIVAVAIEAFVSEGDTITFSGTVEDPGSDDLTISWWGDCDGWAGPTVYPNDPMDYPDPYPSPDWNPRLVTDLQNVRCGDDGAFRFGMSAEDDDGGVTIVSGTFRVMNLPPVVTVSSVRQVDEATSVTIDATATDPGSDDLTFTWSWDYGPTETRTYYNDGVGPDPPGSPWGTFPFTAADSSTHTYGDDCHCTVTLTVADDDGFAVTYMTTVEVVNVPPTITADVTATFTGDLTLRVAGEKWHDVTLTVYDHGTETHVASVTRYPGSPDDQAVTVHNVTIDFQRSDLSAVVLYTPDDDPVNGQPNGADPAWLIMTAKDGSQTRIHHTFNVRHPETWTWEVEDLTALLVGLPIEFTASAGDVGSDDLTFTWDWGDGSSTATTHFNDGVGPDSYPSPDVNPIAVAEATSHAYGSTGTYAVTLTVTDDDGGSTTATIVVDLG